MIEQQRHNLYSFILFCFTYVMNVENHSFYWSRELNHDEKFSCEQRCLIMIIHFIICFRRFEKHRSQFMSIIMLDPCMTYKMKKLYCLFLCKYVSLLLSKYIVRNIEAMQATIERNNGMVSLIS